MRNCVEFTNFEMKERYEQINISILGISLEWFCFPYFVYFFCLKTIIINKSEGVVYYVFIKNLFFFWFFAMTRLFRFIYVYGMQHFIYLLTLQKHRFLTFRICYNFLLKILVTFNVLLFSSFIANDKTFTVLRSFLQ